MKVIPPPSTLFRVTADFCISSGAYVYYKATFREPNYLPNCVLWLISLLPIVERLLITLHYYFAILVRQRKVGLFLEHQTRNSGGASMNMRGLAKDWRILFISDCRAGLQDPVTEVRPWSRAGITQHWSKCLSSERAPGKCTCRCSHVSRSRRCTCGERGCSWIVSRG